AGGRFVEEKQGRPRGGRGGRAANCCRRASAVELCFRQITHQLESLALAAGQGVDRLAEAQIAEADFLEQPQFFQGASRRAGVGESREEFDHFVHRGVEQIGDGPLFASSRREEALTSSQSSVRPPIRARRWSLLTSAAANFQPKDV